MLSKGTKVSFTVGGLDMPWVVLAPEVVRMEVGFSTVRFADGVSDMEAAMLTGAGVCHATWNSLPFGVYVRPPTITGGKSTWPCQGFRFP